MKQKKVWQKKEKAAAILLALFLGFLTYIYTYKYTSTKFWVFLILNVLLFWTLFIPVLTWLFAIIDTIISDSEMYETYYD